MHTVIQKGEGARCNLPTPPSQSSLLTRPRPLPRAVEAVAPVAPVTAAETCDRILMARPRQVPPLKNGVLWLKRTVDPCQDTPYFGRTNDNAEKLVFAPLALRRFSKQPIPRSQAAHTVK